MKLTSDQIVMALMSLGIGLLTSVAFTSFIKHDQPQTKTVTVTKVPDSCIDALNIDNQIFTKVGNALGEYGNTVSFTDKMTDANNYMQSIVAKRTELFGKCVEGK